MPVFCGKVISLEMSCGLELKFRGSSGKGQRESMELETSRSVALASRATTVVTAHTVLEAGEKKGWEIWRCE